MPIKEASFRIGCGRYIQKPGALGDLAAEAERLGTAPLVIGGRTALSLTRGTLEEQLKGKKYKIVEHLGSCNDAFAEKMAELTRAEGYDLIVGVGGGVIMDLAKLVGNFASLPVLNIPTSTATCAAYTPLSVRYTEEGRTVGTTHHGVEVNAVLADTALLATQPPRLLLSGVFDALAKFIEIKHRFKDGGSDHPLGLDWAYVLSAHSYEELMRLTEPCLADMAEGRINDGMEQLIFTSLAATGVISGIARGSNQTALAHKFYEATRVLYYAESRPYLHGEIVGVGLLLQNAYNGEEESNAALLSMMKGHGMPASVGDVGIPLTEEAMNAYYETLLKSSAVLEGGEGAAERLRASLEYLWRLK